MTSSWRSLCDTHQIPLPALTQEQDEWIETWQKYSRRQVVHRVVVSGTTMHLYTHELIDLNNEGYHLQLDRHWELHEEPGDEENSYTDQVEPTRFKVVHPAYPNDYTTYPLRKFPFDADSPWGDPWVPPPPHFVPGAEG